MTNYEYLQQMPIDDFVDWLCTQIWNDYKQFGKRTDINIQRYHSVRNILLMEHEKEDE